MFKKKKGALELSISTIVVIVIGVTLLSLGLIFLRGIFTEITDIKDAVFTGAHREIDELGSSGKVSLPQKVDVEQNELVGFTIFITHDGSISSEKAVFRLQLIPNAGGQFEKFVEARIISSSEVVLNQGQRGEYVIRVFAVGDAPLSTDASYQVLITCDVCGGDPYHSSGFIIDVKEKSGFF